MAGSQRNQSNEIFCEEHPDADIYEDYSAGDMICSQCGLVLLDRVIDVSAEWRKFNENDGSSNADPSRVGSAQNPLLNQDLTTIIGPSSSGNVGATKYSNRNNVNSSDRTLMNVFAIIANMAEKLNGKRNVVSKANEIFKEIHDVKKTKGRSHDAYAAACLYIAFRQEQVPRTFKEICAVCPVSAVTIKRCFSKIMQTVRVEPLVVVDIKEYIPRFCGNLNLPIEIIHTASHIATQSKQFPTINYRSPITIAAASIYMAIQGTKHQSMNEITIGIAAGVAESTIKEVYKEMQIFRAKLLPKKY